MAKKGTKEKQSSKKKENKSKATSKNEDSKTAKGKKQDAAKKGIPASLVKELREKTGAGILDCKKALEECGGDVEKAVDFLRKKGLERADKKSSRTASEGIIHSYIHSNGKIGVMIELRCETDFVARTDDFKELANDLCLQIAASNPLALVPEELPQEIVEKEKEIYREQLKDKPKNKIEQILEGKMKKFYKESCLMHQPFIKDPKQKLTIQDLIKNYIAKLGENIQIKRFTRYELGEE
ncbi:MAG: translation elongation factor Ts [Planctomycetota bacterium]|nr:MAG: translation elongation factor Ts [Planctomycetota bacterium]